MGVIALDGRASTSQGDSTCRVFADHIAVPEVSREFIEAHYRDGKYRNGKPMDL
jgi:hypothetical protein